MNNKEKNNNEYFKMIQQEHLDLCQKYFDVQEHSENFNFWIWETFYNRMYKFNSNPFKQFLVEFLKTPIETYDFNIQTGQNEWMFKNYEYILQQKYIQNNYNDFIHWCIIND